MGDLKEEAARLRRRVRDTEELQADNERLEQALTTAQEQQAGSTSSDATVSQIQSGGRTCAT